MALSFRGSPSVKATIIEGFGFSQCIGALSPRKATDPARVGSPWIPTASNDAVFCLGFGLGVPSGCGCASERITPKEVRKVPIGRGGLTLALAIRPGASQSFESFPVEATVVKLCKAPRVTRTRLTTAH
jgi:hypothetical protein